LIILIDSANIKNNTNDNPTRWIIDSGIGINLTNEVNNLKNKNDVNNKNITYPNDKLGKIKSKVTYNGKFKNNKFFLSNVYYASNIYQFQYILY